MPSFIADGAAMVIERGWLVLHESGTDVKFTQAGACSLNSCLLADRPNSCTSPQLGRFLSFDQSISRLVERILCVEKAPAPVPEWQGRNKVLWFVWLTCETFALTGKDAIPSTQTLKSGHTT